MRAGIICGIVVLVSAHVADANPTGIRSATESTAPGPYTVSAMGSPRLTPTAGDDEMTRIGVAFARRWRDRWQTAARLSTEIGDGGDVFVTEEELELGIWLHPSRRIDLLLGWRAGFAQFRISRGDGPFHIHATMFEPVIELAVRLGRRIELRFAPTAATAFNSGMWHLTFGPEVGVAVRL